MGRMSRMKGKRGELDAVHYLRALGFEDARRTSQYNGKMGAGDIICEETLTRIHFEVKVHKAFDLGRQGLVDACSQADSERRRDQAWVVLWRRHGSSLWLLTTHWYGIVVTVFGDETIKHVLAELQRGMEENIDGEN